MLLCCFTTMSFLKGPQLTSLVCYSALAEEATKSKGGHFAKLKWFSIAKITFLWRGLKFKRGHGPPGPPISAAYAVLLILEVQHYNSLLVLNYSLMCDKIRMLNDIIWLILLISNPVAYPLYMLCSVCTECWICCHVHTRVTLVANNETIIMVIAS